MIYTILSARYANPENTAAVAQTAEAGAVAFEAAKAEEWAALLAALTPAAFEPPTAPVREVTARQFKFALWKLGYILEEHVSSPELPPIAVAALQGASEDQRVNAKSTWANMTRIPENDPLLEAIRQAAGKTVADRTALFDFAVGVP